MRYTQPQGGPLEIDSSLSISNGLAVVVNGNSAYNVVKNSFFTPSGAPPQSVNTKGAAFSFTSGSSQYFTSEVGVVTGFPLTIISFATISTLASSGVLFCLGTTASSTHLHELYYNTAGDLFMLSGDATIEQAVASGVITTNTPLAIGGRVTSATLRDVFLNSGTPLASNTVSISPNALDKSVIGAQLYNAAFSGFLNGTLNLTLVWNRALSNAEIDSVMKNPWQIFKDDEIVLSVAAASGSGVGSSSGLATVSGTAASTAASPGASAGIGAASGTAASTAASTGTTAGIATVSGVGASTVNSVGASTGIGAAAGVAASTVNAVASTSGVATVTGVSPAVTDTGVGSSSGASTVLGVSASTVSAIGSAVGLATVSGVSPDTSSQFSGGFIDYGENARIKRRDIEAREAVAKTQEVEIISVKPVSQIEPTNKKRQDRLDKAIALATQENAALRALNIERDAEIKNLLLAEQAIRNEDEEVLLIYAATLRQPMQIAA